MKFGSFLDNREQKNIRYSYRKRGMEGEYRPDMIPEYFDFEYLDSENGNLFYGKPVAWKGDVIAYGGVDICIDLSGEAYADHARLCFENSELNSIEIFTKKGGKLQKIGVMNPQSGKTLTDDEIEIPVGVYCDNIIVRLNGACKNITLTALDIFGAWDMEDAVYPIPENIEFKGGAMIIDSRTRVEASGVDALFAADYFSERFADKYGIDLKTGEDKKITFEIADTDAESFEIEVSGDKCRVTAGSRRSLIYAAESLMQLTDGTKIKICSIKDKPFMNFRGVHIALPSRNQIDFLKSLVKNLIVPMRYNVIILQISAAMRYDNFPEINKMWLKACENYEKGIWPKPAHYGFVGRDILEKSEVSDICSYMRSFGLEIIPEVQSWSHCQYITTAYPELAEESEETAEKKEIDSYAEDIRPETFYKHSMCPSHEKYYDVIFGIANEVIDVVKPERFVHMGHDEIYELCICDKCKKLDPGALYAEEVTRLNEFIKSKNLQMMIWADMIQERSYKSVTAINRLPKDVIMLDFIWYFHNELDLEDNLLGHGFKVILGNMYSSYYPRFESRSKKEGVIGAEVSAWVPCSEKDYSFEGKMYDYVYSANCLWNRNYNGKMRLAYDEIIRPILFDIRRRIGNLDFGGDEAVLKFDSESTSVPADLTGHIPYNSAAVCSSESPEISMDFEGFANLFSFVHATDINADRFAWEPAQKIGEYVIGFEDGSEFTDDIRFGDNIHGYRFRFGTPLRSHLFRHEGYIASYSAKPICGKTALGEDYTLLEAFVKNPYPEKKIKTVRLKHMKNTDAQILLFGAKAFVK